MRILMAFLYVLLCLSKPELVRLCTQEMPFKKRNGLLLVAKHDIEDSTLQSCVVGVGGLLMQHMHAFY